MVQVRDEVSFVDFVTVRWAALYRLAFLLTGNAVDADDLLQTSLMKAYAAWERIATMAAPEAYVRTIITNTLISGRRSRGWHVLSYAEPPQRPAVSHEQAVVDWSGIWPLVKGLPARQRAVIVLRYYEGMSEREIAAVLHCSPGTVKSQASDALRSLRLRLGRGSVTQTEEPR